MHSSGSVKPSGVAGCCAAVCFGAIADFGRVWRVFLGSRDAAIEVIVTGGLCDMSC